MRDIIKEKKTERDYILLKPGWVSAAAFPVFGGIACLVLFLLCFIHYPRMVNGRVLLTGINRTGNMITVEIDIPESNLYDIAEGQPIQIRLADYPSTRFGTLEGKVNYVYGVTVNNNLKAQLFMPSGLQTSRMYDVVFRQDLKGDALIVIKDMRLIQRIFNGTGRSPGQ